MKKLLLLSISLFLINQTTYGQEVTIGTQIWQTTNLNVTSYRDGTPIPEVTDPTQWAALTTGAWCYYNNTTANGTTYGKLYNWYAVAGIHDTDPNTPNKILAPTGYHIPTDAEWTTLTTFLGGVNVAGGKMKETGTAHWISPNNGATNSSGFTGLPGGYRFYDATFFYSGTYGFWWSWSEYDTTNAWLHALYYDYGRVDRSYDNKRYGFSVRCLNGESILSNATFETNTLKLYPNPVVSFLNVNIDSNLINQPYSIIDGLGRVVLNGNLNEFDNTINVEQLSKGIYYLKISGNSSSKFIKE